MRHRRFICAIGLALLWFGRTGMACGDDTSRGLSAPAPRPAVKHVANGPEPEGEQILMQLVIVELRGDILKLIKLLGPALRKAARTANHKEVVDVDGCALRIVFGKTQPAPNISKAGFVEEPVRKDPCVADRVILTQYR